MSATLNMFLLRHAFSGLPLRKERREFFIVTQPQRSSSLHVFAPNYSWSLIWFQKASIHSAAAWQRQQQKLCCYYGMAERCRSTFTLTVKSNCFCISSCWLLIYATVYLYLCWGFAQASWVCFSACFCAAAAKVRRQAACCVNGCRGNIQTPASGGLCIKYRC